MRAVIIAHGAMENFQEIVTLLLPDDLIIAADGGAVYAEKLGIVPQLLVGDFDSIPAGIPESLVAKGVELHRFSKEKDETDTHLALIYAVEKGCEEILVLGGMGSRLDHSLANIFLAFNPKFQQLSFSFRNEYQEIIPLRQGMVIHGQAGDTFSLIPLEKIEGLNITGAKYPLVNANVDFGSSLTISNEFQEEQVHVSWENGEKLLLVKVFQNA